MYVLVIPHRVSNLTSRKRKTGTLGIAELNVHHEVGVRREREGAYHVDQTPGAPAHARHPGGVLSSDNVVVVVKKRS